MAIEVYSLSRDLGLDSELARVVQQTSDCTPLPACVRPDEPDVCAKALQKFVRLWPRFWSVRLATRASEKFA